MVAAMRRTLIEAGVDEDDIRTEEFSGYWKLETTDHPIEPLDSNHQTPEPVRRYTLMANSSEAIGQTTTSGKRPHSKIPIDGGDSLETTRIQLRMLNQHST